MQQLLKRNLHLVLGLLTICVIVVAVVAASNQGSTNHGPRGPSPQSTPLWQQHNKVLTPQQKAKIDQQILNTQNCMAAHGIGNAKAGARPSPAQVQATFAAAAK